MSELTKVPMNLSQFLSLASITREMTKSYGGMYIKAGNSVWHDYTPQGQKLDKPYALLSPEHFEAWENMNDTG